MSVVQAVLYTIIILSGSSSLRIQVADSQLHKASERITIARLYCRPTNFGRSEQEDKHKGDENKSAKYGLTAFKDQITLHLRLCSWKSLSRNRVARELMNRGLPWLPCHERFGPNMTRKELNVAQGAPHSCCDACLRGDSAWIGLVVHNCGSSEPASSAGSRQSAREATRSEEKRRETTGRPEGPNHVGRAAGHAISRKGTSLQRLTC